MIFAPEHSSYVYLVIETVICVLVFTSIGLQSPYIPMMPQDCDEHAATSAIGYSRDLAESTLPGTPEQSPTAHGCCFALYSIFVLEVALL